MITIVGPVGRLDVPELDQAIRECVAEGRSVVDLSAVTLIDAAVARSLRTGYQRATREGLPFAVGGADGQPRHVLEVLGIAKDLGAHLTLAEAVAQVGADGYAPERVPIDARVHQLIAEARAPGVSEDRTAALLREAAVVALPLARSAAHQYQRRGGSAEDLVQVAALGLMHAIHGYDPSRDNGFLAYAVPTMLGELRRHFRDHTWMVRPARRVQEAYTAVSHAWPDLCQALAHAPSAADLATYLEIDVDLVRQALQAGYGRAGVSLDGPVNDGTPRTLHDIVGSVDSDLEFIDVTISLRGLIASLSPRDREILRLRATSDLTQAEIGERIGISQMGVSRALTRIFEAVRQALSGPVAGAGDA